MKKNDDSASTPTTHTHIFFQDYLYRWLELYCKPKLQETTFTNYKRIIDFRIIPILGNIEIHKLTPAHGQSFVKNLLDDNLSTRYIEYCFNVTNSALVQAVNWELIQENPFYPVEIPRPRRKKQHNTWSIEQANQFLNFAKFDNPKYYYVFMLALFTGMKRDELLALKWKNMNLDKRVINIVESLVYDKEKFHYLDTKSKLTLPIGEFEVKELKHYKKLQNEFQLKSHILYDDQDLVFCTENGHPIFPRTIATIFDRVIKKAHLPKIRFQDLRHTYATISLEIGIPPKTVQERLGHPNVHTTMDTYSHIHPLNTQKESTLTLSQAIRNYSYN